MIPEIKFERIKQLSLFYSVCELGLNKNSTQLCIRGAIDTVLLSQPTSC